MTTEAQRTANVANARKSTGPRTETGKARSAKNAATHGLTARELDVLRALVDGQTNREIAETLFISPRTVAVHVSNLLTKLEVTTRGQAAAAAVRRRLVI